MKNKLTGSDERNYDKWRIDEGIWWEAKKIKNETKKKTQLESIKNFSGVKMNTYEETGE